LAVEDAAGIEFWDAGDGGFGLGGVEVDYFLGGVFECWWWLENGNEGFEGENVRRIMGYVGKTAKSGWSS
jgi:hypothetical protein